MTRSSVTALDPVHPGEVLGEEFLVPLGLSAAELARRVGVPANRISEIVAGRRAFTGDTALRLSVVLGTSAGFWMNLQKGWEMAVARRERRACMKSDCGRRNTP